MKNSLASVFVVIAGTLTPAAFGLAPVLPLPGGFENEGDVHVIGVYEGEYPPGVRHGHNNHPQGSVKIKIAQGAKPKTLVLTSYEPVLWKIDAPPGTVVRVIAAGYHKQEVTGLGKATPVTLISHAAGDADYFYAHQKAADPNADAEEAKAVKEQYDRLEKRVKQLTGRKVEQFQGEYAGTLFEIR